MEKFGELQSMGSPRVRHNWACTQHIFAKLNEEPYKHVYSIPCEKKESMSQNNNCFQSNFLWFYIHIMYYICFKHMFIKKKKGRIFTKPSIGIFILCFAWKIPWTEELGRLQSMELRRVRHDWVKDCMFMFSFLWFRNFFHHCSISFCNQYT